MNSRLVVAVSVVVIVLVGTAFLVNMQQGASSTTSASSTTTTGSQSTTTTGTASGTANSSQSLQLRLYVNASSTGGSTSGVAFNIRVSEYNTLATANNVTQGRDWKLDGLSLGACGTEAYPFGVALYQGSYTVDTVSSAQQLRIYPVVPCPLMLRYITGYLFQPMSDLAVVLPSGPGATATQMSANVTATAEYSGGPSSPTPLGPGTYTVAAGDEWGSIVLVHFTIGAGTSTTATSTAAGTIGTLKANFDIGPTQPVCMANATTGPAPAQYSSIEAVAMSKASGQALSFPVSWLSNGCSVSGSLQASLAPGAYSMSLSSCQWMGCSRAVPKDFVVVAGQTTTVSISIDTGIR